jgi:hypothetical protein
MAILLNLLFCTKDPAKNWNITTIPSVCAKHPRKIRGLQSGPWHGEAAAEFRWAGCAPGRGSGGARPRTHLGPGDGRSWGGGAAGAGARRWPAVAAAAGCGSGEGGAMPSNGWWHNILVNLGSILGWSENTGESWTGEFNGGRQWRARWSGGCGVGRREEQGRALK